MRPALLMTALVGCASRFNPDLSGVAETGGSENGSDTDSTSDDSTSDESASDTTGTSSSDESTSDTIGTSSSTSDSTDTSTGTDTGGGGKGLGDLCHPLLDECETDLTCDGPVFDNGSQEYRYTCVLFTGMDEGDLGDRCDEPPQAFHSNCTQGFACLVNENFPGGQCADPSCCSPYCWTDMDCPFDGICNYGVWDAISGDFAPNLTEYGQWGMCTVA